MKRLLAATLILGTLLCCAGCGSAEPGQNPTENFDTEGYRFTYNGLQIVMNAEAAPIIAALGEPKSYTEETSCAFDGLDKTYYYGSFYLTTYPADGSDYVYSLWFADDSVSTEEGIRIGATQAEVEQAYGADSFNESNACILTKGDTKLTIILSEGAVRIIHYEALFE